MYKSDDACLEDTPDIGFVGTRPGSAQDSESAYPGTRWITLLYPMAQDSELPIASLLDTVFEEFRVP